MAIFLRGKIENEIERIQAKLEKDLGIKLTKTNTVRKILDEYRKGEY
jgi:hypothetical protein